jgi:microcystin-dependent protein
MAETFTPNLNLSKPDIGGSDNIWGDKLNSDMDKIDAQFAATGTGTVIRRNAAGHAAVGTGIDIVDAVATTRAITWFSGLIQRWVLGVNNAAETGSPVNSGSAFFLARCDDGGNVLDVPLSIDRSTGIIAMPQVPTAAGSPVVTQATLPSTGALSEPVGTIKMWVGAGTADPPAVGGVQYYMLCDGRLLTNAAFPALAAIIGTQYGGTPGTNFNLPDTRERVPIGHSTTRTRVPQFDCTAMGNSFGEGQHTQIAAEVGSHAHTITDPKHHHISGVPSINAPGGGGGLIGGTTGAAVTSDELTNITINASPAAAPMNIVQPSVVVQFIIRVQ